MQWQQFTLAIFDTMLRHVLQPLQGNAARPRAEESSVQIPKIRAESGHSCFLKRVEFAITLLSAFAILLGPIFECGRKARD